VSATRTDVSASPASGQRSERVRAQSANPTAEGTLLDALSARKDDGVNWQARIAAAVELRRGQNGISATPAATHVHLTIYAP